MSDERTIQSLIDERKKLYMQAMSGVIRPTAAVNARLRRLDKMIRERIPLGFLVDEENEVSDGRS